MLDDTMLAAVAASIDPTQVLELEQALIRIPSSTFKAFAGGGLFGLFHEGGIAGEQPPALRYADAAVFEDAPRYHGGGFAGSGCCRTRCRSSRGVGSWWCRPSG